MHKKGGVQIIAVGRGAFRDYALAGVQECSVSLALGLTPILSVLQASWDIVARPAQAFVYSEEAFVIIVAQWSLLSCRSAFASARQATRHLRSAESARL